MGLLGQCASPRDIRRCCGGDGALCCWCPRFGLPLPWHPLDVSNAGIFFVFLIMPDVALTDAAQHWTYVVLIWVGFGTLAGLLATVVLPLRRPAGPYWAVVLGITGSTIGLLGLSWLFPSRELNPICPLGFLAASIGTFVLLVLCHLGRLAFGKPENDAGKGT